METALLVKVGGDIKGLESSLKKGSEIVQQFGAKVKVGANQAGNALQNLGRIAQDAPFGFIGIQNNINPLIESFQRLKVETGSTKNALSALASGLLGGGGLGLAISVATGLLTVLAQQGFFKTEKAIDAAKEKTEAFAKALENIFKEAAKEAVEVQSLIVVLKSETATRERKLQVLKELNDINPEVFNGLRLEGNAVIGLDAAYKNYIANLRTVIAVKLKQQQLEEITTKILQNEGATLTKSQQQGLEILKKYNKERQNSVRDGQILTIGDKKQAEVAREQNSLYGQQAELLEQLLDLQAGVKVSAPKEKKERIKDLKTEAEILTGLAKAFQLIAIEESALGKDLDPQRISAIQSAMKSLLDINVSATSKTVKDLAEQLRQLAPLALKNKVDLFTVNREPLPQVKAAVDPTKSAPGVLRQIIDLQNEAANKTAKLAGVISNTLGGAFQSVFSDIISGGQNAMQSFGNAIKQVVAKLLSAIATAAILAAVLSLTGIGATSATGAKLTSFKDIFRSLPKFAEGGATRGGGGRSVIVGDNPSGVEFMTPQESIGNLASQIAGKMGNLGNNGAPYILRTEIAGSDLRLVLERENKLYGRSF